MVFPSMSKCELNDPFLSSSLSLLAPLPHSYPIRTYLYISQLTISSLPPVILIDQHFSSRIGELSLAVQCAKVAGFTWAGSDVEKCVEGKLGKELLVKSVKEVQKWGVEKSATILIGEERKVSRFVLSSGSFSSLGSSLFGS